MLEHRGAVWGVFAEVVDAVEADFDVLVASVENRVMARVQAAYGEPSAAFRAALHRGVSATVRDALARLRFDAELPRELLPDLLELARLCADSRWELAGVADPWLVGQEVFSSRWASRSYRLSQTAPPPTSNREGAPVLGSWPDFA